MGQMSEFRPGDKVAVHGEIAEISGTTAIIRSGGGLVAADLGQLEHSVTAGGVQSPAGIPGAVTAVYDEGSAAVTEPQLSFVVTKYWDRPEGQAGWTEMTCSKAPFPRVLEWMLEELPAEAVTIYSGEIMMRLAIAWSQVPEGVRAPVIAPYVPADPAGAERARLLEIVKGWPVHETALQLTSAVYGLLSQPQVPEPGEPS